MISIAGAVPGDESAIALLCEELDEFYGRATAGTLERRAALVSAALFTDPPLARVLVAWDGPVPAGLASYSFLWPAAGLSTGLYLKELYVARAYRRAGTGKLLMDGLFKIAADAGCSRVEWTTDSGNTSARAFYEALGAKLLTTKLFYLAAGIS